MALPKQIQRQVKQSQELEKQIREGLTDQGAAAQQEIDALLAEVTAPDSPEPPPAQAADTPEKPDDPPARVNGSPAQPEAPDTPDKPERVDWKHKYSTLKGKYDAEVPRLTQELERANARLSQLEEKLLQRPETPPPAAPAPRTDFTADEIEEYGEDLLDVIGRKARQIVEREYLPNIEALKNEIRTLEHQLGATSQRVHHQEQNQVFAYLDREVKDWRTINTDPEFKEWLDQPDLYSGQLRRKLLMDAFNANNALRVKTFFEGFIQEHAAVTPGAADTPPEETSTLDLGEFVAPGTPRGTGASSTPRERRNWTRTEIKQFYADVQKGRYRDRPADKARIEADIAAATNQGRVL